MRAKVLLTLLVCVFAIVAGAVVLSSQAGSDYEQKAQDNLDAALEAVLLAHRLEEYSLATAARFAADADAVRAGFACPATADELRAANRERTPMVDPATGEPVRNAAGLVLDTEGQPILDAGGVRCNQTQHEAVLAALRSWQTSLVGARDAASGLPVAERPLGFTVAREPDIIVAADANGVVIARVGADSADWFGPSRPNMSAFGPVAAAELAAEAGSNAPQAGDIIWREYETADPRLATVGVAPVFSGTGSDRTFLGTIIIGSFMNDEAATEVAGLMSGVDLIYWFRVDNTTRRASSNGNMMPGLAEEIRGAELFIRNADGSVGDTASAFDAVTGTIADAAYQLTASTGTYLVRPFGLTTADDGSLVSGAIVVTSLSQQTAPLRPFKSQLPLFAIVMFILGVVAILFTVKQYVAPIEEISRGVQEVIAGNKDYMWPVDDSSHLADLSHSLNIMSARLQGKRDPDADEGEGSEAWAASSGGTGDGAAKPPAGVGGIAGLRRRTEEPGAPSDSE